MIIDYLKLDYESPVRWRNYLNDCRFKSSKFLSQFVDASRYISGGVPNTLVPQCLEAMSGVVESRMIRVHKYTSVKSVRQFELDMYQYLAHSVNAVKTFRTVCWQTNSLSFLVQIYSMKTATSQYLQLELFFRKDECSRSQTF